MRWLSRLSILVVLASVLLACNYPGLQPAVPTAPVQPATPLPTRDPGTGVTPPPAATLPPVETAPSAEISLELLKNYSYWVEDFNVQATLTDGVFSSDPIQVQLIEPVAVGDLNGDGQPDAAVILTIKSGGTGTFFDLIALVNQEGKLVQAGSAFLGDRQIIKDLHIAEGRIVLDYNTQGLSDPMCCPNEHRLSSFVLDTGALRLASEQVLDSPDAQAAPLPNAILIDEPGKVDHLAHPQRVRGRVSLVPPERVLAYYVVDSSGTLLDQGEVPLQGEPGGPGTFLFEFSLGDLPAGLIQLELVDAANGILRGRSVVVLLTP